ncbi:hypothetical protein WJX75_005252 [Coccomyxa subellipsoidea]|uniref:Uncharacterized protein n=1 Tax=Coccomyxa subellipsoidea TaxID=248742 RepID=A0ABR2YGH1_9CHLO
MADGVKPNTLINPFISNAKPAAKVVGWAAGLGLPERSATAAAGGFLTGITLFSGSIYAYVLTGRKAFQYLTPFGGLSFMAGWGAVALYHLGAAARSS